MSGTCFWTAQSQVAHSVNATELHLHYDVSADTGRTSLMPAKAAWDRGGTMSVQRKEWEGGQYNWVAGRPAQEGSGLRI